MPWSSNFKKGVHRPTWESLAPFPQGPSYSGASCVYDGSRYIYWALQYSSTSTSVGTTHLWRYCTWTDGWQFLTALTSGNSGLDIDYDPVRNCIWIASGNTSTEWRCFSLNTTNISVSGVTITPWTITTMTPVLPATPGAGGTIQLVDDSVVTEPMYSGTVSSATSTTVVVTGSNEGWAGHVGLALRLTSGAATGDRRTISAVSTSLSANTTTFTVSAAFSSTPSGTDTFVIEYPQGTATAGSSTTLTDSGQAWTTNKYANHDVLITSGTGSGQRRRIASNTATVLTLASAVTGNTRTGNWTTAPDATSVYKIVPSSDFLYFASGNSTTTFYKIDLNTGSTATTWTTLAATPSSLGAASNLVAPRHTPSYLFVPRGNGTGTLYHYDIGLNTWTTLTVYGGETFQAGVSTAMIYGKNRVAIIKEGSTRILAFRLGELTFEPIGTLPYGFPPTYDGDRMEVFTSVDGVQWLYILRAGGQEFFRVPLEWL